MQLKDVPPWAWWIAGGLAVGTVLAWRSDAYSATNLPPLRFPRTTGSRNPPGPEYEPRHLPKAFADSPAGRREFVAYMLDMLAGEGLTGEPAILFTAHVGRETGFGKSVYGDNWGNIKQYGDGPWHRLADGQPYRTYTSPRAGIRDNIEFLRDRNGGRYRRAWEMLLAGNPNWYGQMGLSGYYECGGAGDRHTCTSDEISVPQADYNRTLASVRNYMVTT